jgi:GxxExxY protein
MVNLQKSELTDAIICCFYNVYNRLGVGFLEKVYENALLVELKKLGLIASAQCPISVFYDEVIVGEYFADIVVEGSLILEIKAVSSLTPAHEAQLVNYLKATGLEVGLLLNFGPEPQVKRKVNSLERRTDAGQQVLKPSVQRQ